MTTAIKDDGSILETINGHVRKITDSEWKAIDRVVEKRLRNEELSEKESSFFETFTFIDSPKFLKLRPVQQRFIIAYALREVFDFSNKDIWRFAANDYTSSDKKASIRAIGMKEKRNVKYFLEKIDWKRIEALGFSTSKVIEAEMELAYSDITDYIDEEGTFIGDLKKLPQRARRAIKSFEIQETINRNGDPVRKYKIKLWDKGASLQRIQKIKGMQVDQVNISSTNTNANINSDMTPQEAGKAYAEMMKRG